MKGLVSIAKFSDMKSFLIVFLVILAFVASCVTSKFELADLLVGTWKVKDKEQYEVWERAGAKELKGYGYRLEEGEQQITETLRIRKSNGQWAYEATVPGQNDGATIRFFLNTEVRGIYSFENLEHDFPQKIRYKPLSTDSLEVIVQGDEGKGFSYIQTRVKMD